MMKRHNKQYQQEQDIKGEVGTRVSSRDGYKRNKALKGVCKISGFGHNMQTAPVATT